LLDCIIILGDGRALKICPGSWLYNDVIVFWRLRRFYHQMHDVQAISQSTWMNSRNAYTQTECFFGVGDRRSD